MSRALRVIVVVCFVALLPGCGRAGPLLGILLLRTALVLAVAAEHGGGSHEVVSVRPEPGPVDVDNARGVLAAAAERARGCRRARAEGPWGRGLAYLAVQPSGEISEVRLDARFAGTEVGHCVAEEMLASAIKPYRGESVVFSKSFVVD